MKCNTCGAEQEPFMSFGPMPIANRFLSPDAFDAEYFFELAPVFCDSCSTFQLAHQPAPEEMFHENYSFFSRTSKRMVQHFKAYAEWALAQYGSSRDPFMIEIGSNDGILLENYSRRNIRHLGFEPSANVAAEARRHGVSTRVAFFGEKTATEVSQEFGSADAILAANVMCHIRDLADVARGADALLKDDGVLVFEDPYLGDVVQKGSYDQIYDEHVYLFSAHAVRSIFGRRDFELIDVLPQSTHGGSMRYVLARKGKRVASPAVSATLAHEEKIGLGNSETFDRFRERCEISRDSLVAVLERLRDQDQRVAGYGATSKSTTVLNYCGIDSSLVEFIADTTPIKQGKYSPGAHIPIRPYEAFASDYPDVALLLAWNHREEIIEKEGAFEAAGGRWLDFVPEVALSPA